MQSLKDNLPLISAFFLVLGALNLILYYGYFDIDIMSYIELSEIFVLSISFFIKAVIVLIISMILLTSASVRQSKRIVQQDNSYEPHKQELTIISFALSAVMVLIMFTMYNTYVDFAPTIDGLIAFIVIIFVSYSVGSIKLFMNLFFKELFSFENIKSISIPFVVLLSIAVLMVVYTRYDARNVAYNKEYVYVEMKIDSVLIHSDSIYRYIGKTKNYAFFYNARTSRYDAYQLSEVQKITITNRHIFDGMLIKPKILLNK